MATLLANDAEAVSKAAEPVTNALAATPCESAEISRLRAESERLKVESENERLRVELRKATLPWWRKGTIVTTLTAIVAAVIPVTTAVQAHFQKQRELALQESKQANDIRTSYLDRLDKPGAKLRTLRFVLATTADPALKAWAHEEAKQVQAELDEIDQKIAALEMLAAPPTPTTKPDTGPQKTKVSDASASHLQPKPAGNTVTHTTLPPPIGSGSKTIDEEIARLRIRHLEGGSAYPIGMPPRRDPDGLMQL